MTIVNEMDLDALVLDSGSHAEGAGMCVMEAVAWMAGEAWSDHPDCVSPVIGAFMRRWNDALDDDARQTLKAHIPAVIGTAKGDDCDRALAWMATDWLVRVQTPAWLRLAGLNDQADTLAAMPELDPETCPSILPALRAVRSDSAAAWAAAWAAAGAAAGDAAGAAAGDAAGDAAGAAAWAAQLACLSQLLLEAS